MKISKLFYLIIIAFITILPSTLKTMWGGEYMGGWEEYVWEPSYETSVERERYRSLAIQDMIREEERLEKLRKEDLENIKSAQEAAARSLIKKWLNAQRIRPDIINSSIINNDLNALNINLKYFLLEEVKKEKSLLNKYHPYQSFQIRKLDRIENLINENLL